MYKLLLILKYLRRKLAPMFAALAVTLCTAMVIIVISVMGGFLQMWRDSAKKLTGEITISAGLPGMAHYEELLGAVKASPDVAAATAIVFTYGIIRIDEAVLKMEIVGIHPEELNEVVAYRDSIYWTPRRIEASRHQVAAESTPEGEPPHSTQEIGRPARPVNVADIAERRDVTFQDGELTVTVTHRQDVKLLRILGPSRQALFEGPVGPAGSAADARLIFQNIGLTYTLRQVDGVLQLKVVDHKGETRFEGPIDEAAARALQLPGLDRTLRIHTAPSARVMVIKDPAGKVVFDWPVETELQQRSIPPRWSYHLIQYRSLDGQQMVDAAMTFKPPAQWQSDLPGIVPGVVVYAGPRDKDGEFNIYRNPSVGKTMAVTVVPLTERGTIVDHATREFIVVNELKSGFIDFDQNRVYVPFDVLQDMLDMEPQTLVDGDGKVVGESSPRASAILVRGGEGVELATLKKSVHDAIDPVIAAHRIGGVRIMTWEEQHATILGAVEKEKFLLVFLFAIISLVAFVMVATTFYNIVLEKTRDIGVLRALGASRGGVAGLFLGYGVAIGIVGAAAGFVLAWLVVNHINGIQTFLERQLGSFALAAGAAVGGLIVGAIIGYIVSVLRRYRGLKWMVIAALSLAAVGVIVSLIVLVNDAELNDRLNAALGIKIWDAQIYYFDHIPAKLNGTEVVVIMIAAVLSSVFGSLIPALLAARLDPVEALRYE